MSWASACPADKREEFLKQWDTKLFVAHGAVLKEYVVVPDELFRNMGDLLKYLDVSYQYVVGLKPKKPRASGASRGSPKSTRRGGARS